MGWHLCVDKLAVPGHEDLNKECQSPLGPPRGGPEPRLICACPIAEASQQMAELSEVLVLRLEGYERQQKEITQLQAEITKLQQRCQSVSCTVGAPPSSRLHGTPPSARPRGLTWVGISVSRG